MKKSIKQILVAAVFVLGIVCTTQTENALAVYSCGTYGAGSYNTAEGCTPAGGGSGSTSSDEDATTPPDSTDEATTSDESDTTSNNDTDGDAETDTAVNTTSD